MADVENQQEVSLPVKRKPDLYCQDQDDVANKAQKLQPSNSTASECKDGENRVNIDSAKDKTEIETEPAISPEKDADSAPGRNEIGGGGGVDLVAEEEEEEVDDDEEEEEARREAEIERKGKGIMRDDKGKGKLVEEDDSDDEDDDGDDEDEDDDEEVDSDLSDDPLAEVDLDNILPSRTRRRSMQPGLYFSDEIANHEDDDDDDSEDSDA